MVSKLRCLYGRRRDELNNNNMRRWWRLVATVTPWLLLLLLFGAVVPPVQSHDVVATFSPGDTFNTSHVVVDPHTGRVYVGAVNWLFQLDAELKVEARVRTGPVNDNVQCFPAQCSGSVPVSPLNNVNKILVLEPLSKRLIACGSVYQGSCRLHRPENISVADEIIAVPVAANDENSSTIAFLGPARYLGHGALYVAATNTRLGPYRELVPAISARYLDPGRRFNIVEKSFSSIARVDVSSQLRDYYLVNYVGGFGTDTFLYFLTVQKKSHSRALEEWGYVSRLARVCADDPAFSTYTEITLQCLGSDGMTDYNLLQDAKVVEAAPELAADLRVEPGTKVLLGVFAASRDHTARPARSSALCAFSLPELEHKFTENIHMCYNGSQVTRDMDYIAGSLEGCPEPGHGGNIVSFCGETLKLNGSLPAVSIASLTYPNLTLTALTATTISHHTVAFVGTDQGKLKKILITGAYQAEEFEEVVVDETGQKILPQLQFDVSRRFLYVPTISKVSKVLLEQCQHYSSCGQCLQARNPYCGWCSLEKRCTVQWACQNATSSSVFHDSPRWLSLNTQQCIDFQSIKPQQLPITDMAVIELEINKLPQLPYGAHYLCVFGNTSPVQAKVMPYGLACTTPSVIDRPAILSDSDHTLVDLAVRSSETNTDFLNRNFAFYDCSRHSTCTSCVTSNWACSWCGQENICVHNTTSCRRNVITGERSPDTSLIKGRQYCPSFSVHDEILLPHGVRDEITIEVNNLPQSAGDSFQCVVEIEGAKERVAATVKHSKIICSETVYTYQADVGEITASLTVLWNQDTFIDRTNITLYKCHLLGSHGGQADCSLCQTRDPRFKCHWCGGSCKFAESCLEPIVTQCPPPRIDWIHPLTGPIEGGTLVTIEGSNLGMNLEEIKDKITIGGIACVPVDYNISVKVVCQTGPSKIALPADVMVANRAGVTKAREQFSYKEVQLLDVHPRMGPQSGGTRLYLTGRNLNTGSKLEVFLDDLPCLVDRTLASNSQISCRTTRAANPETRVNMLTVYIDDARLSLSSPFIYKTDPVVQRISPLKSYVSGGRVVNVFGTGFKSVLQPRMAIFYNETIINETVCEVIALNHMMCPSPSIYGLVMGRRDQEQWRLRVGFLMDDVDSVRELQDNFPSLHSNLTYVQDPVLFPFNSVKLYKGESLVIEGESIQMSSTESEASVFIGTKACNITSLTMTHLVCMPPLDQPAGLDDVGRRTESGLPLVVVRLGSNLRFEIGHLQYERARRYEMPPGAIAALASGGAILIILSLIILAWLRHKSSQAEREYKRIQLQMDTLENSVRSECKQAFAELQTDMTDLTNDLETTGIPTLDHRTYVMKVFFPGVTDHPLFQPIKMRGMYTNCDLAMGQFEHLLLNKAFLLTFIHTMESQRCFSYRDRVNVASLLMVILMEKMEYATEILRALLFQLVDRSIQSKHPQLMLRRTESVVEKMLTNWLALSMYDYLKDQAGSSMFLLFSAIKHQVEKGPVDFVTHDARYCLSEERLLREQTDYMMVTVHVIQEDSDEKITCRVNDCDTISQVKLKILDCVYKNTSFSQRPMIHDVDLEWRHGRGGHLTLRDEDLTSKTLNGGWRRLNTLRHYGIRESAVMSLVNKLNDNSNSKWWDNHIDNPHHLEQALRFWHLVKPVDDNHNKDGTAIPKAVPEIFLTRLLSTKGTVQKFVDDFLSTILTANETLPPAIKWLFDLLDEAATRHGITDPEVAHAWKSNSLPLRFWVNFIKNPDFILDIQKSPVVDSCLSVIAQTLMDACSTTEHRLGKDSPSNKLLFAKDIPTYRKMVTRFYQDISTLPPISDQEMSVTMQSLSLSHSGEFDTLSALRDLYVYAAKYHMALSEALDDDHYCQKLRLSQCLESVACTMQEENRSMC